MSADQRPLLFEGSKGETNDEIERVRQHLRAVLSVAVVTLWGSDRRDTENTFTPEELSDLLTVARAACENHRHVETVYREAYDYLVKCAPQHDDDVPPPVPAP